LLLSNDLVLTRVTSTQLSSSENLTEFSQRLQGLSLQLSLNGDCAVEGNQCLTDDGFAYVLNEKGELVQADTGSGSLNGVYLLILFVGLTGFRCRSGAYV